MVSKSSVSAWFGFIGLGSVGSKGKQTEKYLNAAGIYRQKSHRGGREVWWIACVRTGGAPPLFRDKNEHHMFGNSGSSSSNAKTRIPISVEVESSSSAHDIDESAHTAARMPGPLTQQGCVLAY